jgi:hypothetical protein
MLLDRHIMCRRGRHIGRRPGMARFRSMVRHHSAICPRHTLTGRRPDAGTGHRHPAMCHHRTLMGRLPATTRLPATVHQPARTSHHHTRTGRHPATGRPATGHPATGRHPATDIHPAMGRPPATDIHPATGRHPQMSRTLTGRRRAMGHLPGTVRHHALLSLRRTQFRGRGRMPVT